jgi:hypothetical protein
MFSILAGESGLQARPSRGGNLRPQEGWRVVTKRCAQFCAHPLTSWSELEGLDLPVMSLSINSLRVSATYWSFWLTY